MNVREMNRTKKWLTCLKCGRSVYTDRCHRICPKCDQKNSKEGRIRQISLNSNRGVGTEKLGNADELVNWFSNS